MGSIKFLKDLFTGKDNATWDLGRILWFQGSIVYSAMTIYSLYQGIAIDPLNWATGFGALLAGGGAAIRLKYATEPDGGKGGDFFDFQPKDHPTGFELEEEPEPTEPTEPTRPPRRHRR